MVLGGGGLGWKKFPDRVHVHCLLEWLPPSGGVAATTAKGGRDAEIQGRKQGH